MITKGRTTPLLLLIWLLTLSACTTGQTSWTRVEPEVLAERMRTEDIFLVNVHVPDEGEIPGTDASIPYTELSSRLGELPSDGSLVIYCRSGNMSTEASKELVARGFSAFTELKGGFDAWDRAGLPFIER